MSAELTIKSSRSSRLPNIELCRIVSIIMVLLLHSNFAIFGWPSSWGSIDVSKLLLESFCIIGVNVFVLISGYFSIKIKKSSIINLFYICAFCAIVKLVYDYFFEDHIYWANILFISKANWFIPAYLGLLLISPALNALCDKVDKKGLAIIIICLILFESYFGFFPVFDTYASKNISHGLSIFHFSILYLLARYIRMFGVPRLFDKMRFVIYIGCSLLMTLLASLLILTDHQSIKVGEDFLINQLFDYSNPLNIISAAAFFLVFLGIPLGKRPARFVNYLAQSVLTVLILHTSYEARQLLYPQYSFINNHYDGLILVLYWIISVIVTFIVCAIIDQIRIYSYKYIVAKIKM